MLFAMVIGAPSLFQTQIVINFNLGLFLVVASFFSRPKLFLAMVIQCPSSSLSTLSKFKAMNFLAISELKILSSLPIGDGDPPPFFPLSTLLQLRVLSLVILVFEVKIMNYFAATDNDATPFSNLSTFLKFKTLNSLVVFEFKVLNSLVNSDPL